MGSYSFAGQSAGLERVVNARELGGYTLPDGSRIRKNKLFRGGNLTFATAEDIRILSEKFGICQIFDFRTDMETKHQPDQEIPGAKYLWLPTIDPETEKLGDATLPREAYADLENYLVRHASEPKIQDIAHNMYPSMIRNEYTQLQYAAFLQILANHPGDAFFWHCSQGKDRTGLGAAFLLLALGADMDLVMEDYAISQEYYAEDVKALYEQVERNGDGKEEEKVILTFIGANSEYFKEALDLMDSEFGGAEAYLANQLCLSEEDKASLKAKFLEQPKV